jgi:hypothetical protein
MSSSAIRTALAPRIVRARTVARPMLKIVEATAPADLDSDLDWVAFRARYFPGRRPRHDFQAVVAYGAYKEG